MLTAYLKKIPSEELEDNIEEVYTMVKEESSYQLSTEAKEEPPGATLRTLSISTKDEHLPSINEVDVLPEFQGMTRHAAVEVIFERNRGKVLHPRVIARELYGSFPQEYESTLLVRVREVLKRGKKQDLWFSVPNSGGCYTVDLTVLAS